MSRVRFTLIALGMAFALPALTGAMTSPEDATIDPSTCASQQPPDHEDARWRWRLHAFHHLDCATAIIDRALQSNGAAAGTPSGDRIEISRAELERIRTLALWARDAAARIGQ
jgi:hypothetical protein